MIRHSSKKNRSHYRVKDFVKDVGFDAFNTLKYFRHNLRLGLTRQNHFLFPSNEPPIILLQGFLGTSGVLDPLSRFLQKNKRNVFILDLGLVNIRDIRESAERLVFEVERIIDLYSKEHHFKKIDIVAHSMGGLIAYYYIKKIGGHRLIRKLVALGSPFRGTWSAAVGAILFGFLSRGVWQMLPNSKFLRDLHITHQRKIETQIYSIAAQHDTISTPESCFLKGATNRVLPLGHASLLMDHRVFENILQFLEDKDEATNVVAFEHFRT